MSDDLVKRLRTPMKNVTVQACFKERNEAADRIEELSNCVAVLEAKLAKAVEALDLLALHASGLEKQLTEDLFHQDFCGESVTLTCVRTTLAELKGEDRG